MAWPDASNRPQDFAADPHHPIQVMATVHPSAVLRADDREQAYASLVDDLKIAARAAG